MSHSPKRIKLIANPVAGGDARPQIEHARRCFEAAGCRVELVLTAARGDAEEAARRAREEDLDLLVAAGGDGTLNEVVNGLVPSPLPLAFLPLGTTNVFALEAGIPFAIPAACRIALEGSPTPICLGLAGEARFLLMAGVGFDAEVVARVSTRLKRRVGKLAYLVSALGTLLVQPPQPIEVTFEDGTPPRRVYGAIIGNGRLYGGRFSITRGASLTEPFLEVSLFLRPGRLALLRTLLRVALGRPLGAPDVATRKAAALTLGGDGVPVQIDGDSHGHLPLSFAVTSGELNMILPASPREEES